MASRLSRPELYDATCRELLHVRQRGRRPNGDQARHRSTPSVPDRDRPPGRRSAWRDRPVPREPARGAAIGCRDLLSPTAMSQLALLRRRGFAGLFWTQFLGAFNDNLFKNALVILVVYQTAGAVGARRRSAGAAERRASSSCRSFCSPRRRAQLADRFRKSSLVRWVKLGEIAHHGDRGRRLSRPAARSAVRRAVPAWAATRACSAR